MASAMPETITKAQRWLDLVVFLLRRHFPVSVEQIMEGVPAYAADWATESDTKRASVRRKFERDKDELRELGIPIETVTYNISYGTEQAEGYLLKASEMYLPRLIQAGEEERAPPRPREVSALKATPETWSALARAAHRVARMPESPLAPYGRRALRKLGFDLPDVVAEADEPYVHYLSVPDPAVSDALAVLTPALLARKEVRFEYYSIGRDVRGPRRAWPYGLLYQSGNWYLLARDPDVDALRTFRVSRMSDATANKSKPKTPDYDVPADFRLRDYVGREVWRLGEDEESEIVAEVLFLPPTSWWAEARELGELVRADEATGGQVRAFRVRQLDPFLRWCLTFRGQARPLGPEQVTRGFRELVRAVLALYEEDESTDES